nr:hypothetical protein [Gordonia polyisoprenivorans]
MIKMTRLAGNFESVLVASVWVAVVISNVAARATMPMLTLRRIEMTRMPASTTRDAT